MKFEKGDLIIGLSTADFQYSMTDSHCLMRVEHILETQEAWFDKEGFDMFVVVVAQEHTGKSPNSGYERMHRVNSKFFRLATERDKANFMLGLI